MRLARGGFLLAVLLTSALGLAQEPRTDAAPLQWTFAPLAVRGQDAPGGGKFAEFGWIYHATNGLTLFWARAEGATGKDCGLYSLFKGTLTKAAGDDQRLSESLGRGSEICVGGHSYAAASLPTRFLTGSDVIYASTDAYDFAWDGTAWRTLLPPGRTATVEGRTVVLSPRLINVFEDGTMFVGATYKRDGKSVEAWGLLSGATFTPVATSGMKVGGLQVSKWGITITTRMAFPDGALALLDLKNGPYKTGLFWCTPGKVERVLAKPDFPCAKDPAGECELGSVAVWGKDTIVASVTRKGDGMLVLLHQGKLIPIINSIRELRAGKGFKRLMLPQAAVVKRAAPSFLFSLALQENVAGGDVLVDLYYFDGSQLMPVRWEQVTGQGIEKHLQGGAAWSWISAREVPGSVGEFVIAIPKGPGWGESWSLDLETLTLEKTLLCESGGAKVFRDSVVAWESEHEALVFLGAASGLGSLKRTDAP